ncbi:MAG TPA: pyridoxamine 5'-phosphate oxidase family protein [Polyangiaceae bacterium]|nr:pyridoxamine 5'-phosphate oxidase family protein [Polyangiaceae bacterium]
MPNADPRFDLTQLSELDARFPAPARASIAKELDHVDPNYAAWIRAAPFAVLCTAGKDGLDASPRGDPPGFVEVSDPKTLLLPERRGNNRLDSVRNLLVDPRAALLFMIPGQGETLRVNGRARVSADPALLEHFELHGQRPKLVLVIHVEAVFFQCSRAIVRSELWNPERHVARGTLPSPGKILAAATEGGIDGEVYDRELPGRVRSTLY